ncbi:MAG: BamA/TamA family outer membrane protein [Salinibacter sp.]
MSTLIAPTVGTWRSENGGVAFVLLMGGLVASGVFSPVAAHPVSPTADTTAPIVRSVDVRGARHFSEATLKKRIRTQPNRRIFGIPGFTWWRWVYQLGNADWMWDRLGKALRSGGEPPAYLDSSTVAADVDRLELFYQQRGYRDATVSYRVRPQGGSDRVQVIFSVTPGPATYLRRLRYIGLGALRRSQKRRLVEGTVFDAATVRVDDTLRITLQNQRYREPKLLKERRRILTFLQNEGYAGVSRDSIQAVVYRVAPDSFDVTLRIGTGPRYRFGSVRFEVTGPETTPPRYDTLNVRVDTTGGARPRVTSRIVDEGHLEPGILRRNLQFTPGAYYDRSKVRATKRRLESTGVFTFTNLSPQFEDTVRVPSTGALYLPLRIEGRTRQRHRVQAEAFALQRESVGGGSTGGLRPSEFGVGLSGIYENVNALGGGETFRVRTSGSVATGPGSEIVSSYQFEGSTSLILPYLIRPFRPLEQLDLTSARTRVSLTGLTALRSGLGLRIRSRIDAQLRLEMDHTPTESSLIDVVDLSISNPDTLDQFRSRFLDLVFGPGGNDIQDPVQRQQILEDYTQPQVNTAVRYTFRSATANPLRRQSGHIYEVSGEVGNTVPLLFDRLVFAPDTLDYSVPSFFSGAGGLTGRLLYRPYVRASVDLRQYVPLGPGTTLGIKLFGGIAHPTARPTVVPLDRRFFSGGASSVRGWRLRDLGPGAARLPRDTTTSVQGGIANILGGDIKLESSIELRTTLLQDFLTARWVGATFLDVGNVWFGPRNRGFGQQDSMSTAAGMRATSDVQIGDRDGKFDGLESLTDVGVGGGVGLRLEWQYLIVRFDLAYRLHDPARNDDVFASDFGGPLLHFGIGQSF